MTWTFATPYSRITLTDAEAGIVDDRPPAPLGLSRMALDLRVRLDAGETIKLIWDEDREQATALRQLERDGCKLELVLAAGVSPSVRKKPA